MSNSDWKKLLLDNLARLRAELAAACRRAGRAPDEVHLVAVTKYVALPVVEAVLAAGVIDLGENRVQQLVARARQCGQARFDWPEQPEPNGRGPRWHMIGHLQRNKIKALLPHARIIHSLDSPRLAEALQQHASAAGIHLDVFIEVNLAGEENKTGLPPAQLDDLVAVATRCDRLRLRGLMTMAPYNPDPEAARPYFAQLRELLTRLRTAGRVGPQCCHLSMGMSQDYLVAVEEGATFVRIGSALFEGLPGADPRSA